MKEHIIIVEPPLVRLGETTPQKKFQRKSITLRKAASATKPGKAWKKPVGKPRHPLTAYNLFYQFERANILEGANRPKPTTLKDVMHLGGHSTRKSKKNIPDHKAKIGSVEVSRNNKISLTELTKTIALRWRTLDATTKAIFEERAVVERDRYQRETALWQITTGRKNRANANLPEDSPVPTLVSLISPTYPHQESKARLSTPSTPPYETAEQWHNDMMTAQIYQSQNVDTGIINQTEDVVFCHMGNKYKENFQNQDKSLANNFAAQKDLVSHPALYELDPLGWNCNLVGHCSGQSTRQDVTNKGNEKLLHDSIQESNPLSKPRKVSCGCVCQGCKTKAIIDFKINGQNEIKDLDTSQASSSYQSVSYVLVDANDDGKLVHPRCDEPCLTNCNTSGVSHNDHIVDHKKIHPTCFQPHKPALGDILTAGNYFPVTKEHFLTTANNTGTNYQKDAMHKIMEYHIQEMQRLSVQLCLLESDEQISSFSKGEPHDQTRIGLNRVPCHGNIHDQAQSFAAPISHATNSSQVQAAGAHWHCPHSTAATSENMLSGGIPNCLHSLFPQRPHISYKQAHIENVDVDLSPFHQQVHHSEEALNPHHDPMTWVTKDPVCQDMNWCFHQEEQFSCL